MKPKRLWICFDAHAEDGRVWCVREGNTWHRVPRIVTAGGILQTVYRGRKASQPRAYLVGRGTLDIEPSGAAVVTLAG